MFFLEEKIVKTFFNRGKLLTPGALEILKGRAGEIEKVFDELKDREFLVDIQDFEKKEKDLSEKVIILKNLTEKKKEITTEDFLHFYNVKYEKLKNIIAERTKKPFISLNKVDASRRDVCVIGIVKGTKKQDGKAHIELEDTTRSLTVVMEGDADEIRNEDVIGVEGVAGGKVIFGKRIILPDFPIRQPVTGKGRACFVSDLHLEESPKQDTEKFFKWFEKSEIKHLFVAGDVGDKEVFENLVEKYAYSKKIFVVAGERDDPDFPQLAPIFRNQNIISVSNPSMVEINGIKILMIHKADMNSLRKRYVGDKILYADHLVLDIIPDIIHCGHDHKPMVTNYKSITIANSGSTLTTFRPVVIDFSTREAEQINLDTLK